MVRFCIGPVADGRRNSKRIGGAAFVAGGLAVHSLGSLPPEKQSTPAAAQLASLLAESVDSVGPMEEPSP
jgi:hypothetical protein